MGYRVFTCRHETLKNIPDDLNSTREKTAGVVANEFFRDYAYDSDFMREYNDARATILNHHRAHERIKQGRGEYADNLKGLL